MGTIMPAVMTPTNGRAYEPVSLGELWRRPGEHHLPEPVDQGLLNDDFRTVGARGGGGNQ